MTPRRLSAPAGRDGAPSDAGGRRVVRQRDEFDGLTTEAIP
jgi:hypothetical protein